MSSSDAVIAAQLRQQYPDGSVMENGVSRPMTAPEYDDWIARQVTVAQAQAAAEAALEAQRTLRRQVRVALASLDAGTTTLAQMRAIMAGLIRTLIDQGLIERDG